jgi:hypothetical protein
VNTQGLPSGKPASVSGLRIEETGLYFAEIITRDQENLMAQRIQTLFIDDLDGGEAAGTVRFSLDGTEYEIDLSEQHTDALRTALSKYVEHARKVGGASRRQVRGGRRGADAIDTAKVREWAKGQGIGIKDRGRVPATVVEQYKTAAVA